MGASKRRHRVARRLAGIAAGVVMLLVGSCSTAVPGRMIAGSTPTPSPVLPSAPAVPTPTPTPTPTVTPSATASAADLCVAATMATMSLQQIAAQVLLVGTPIGDPSAIDKTLRAYGFGGVFLAGRSQASAAQLRAEISALQAEAPRGARLLISLDQEGGEVQTLQGADFPPIPTAVAQGRLSPSALRAQARSWARRLAGIGVNLDLAPVADTVPASLGTGNPPIGAYLREYGSDPGAVAADIATVVAAVQSAGVVTTLKHFPGLGRVRVNTDTGTGAVDGVTTAKDPYLGPFEAGIRAGTGAVMVSSATYPKLDPSTIAAFSQPIVTGLLRDRLGFTGLIVSDSLAGAAAVSFVPIGQRAVRFIAAGGDFALTTQYSKAPAMVAALVAAARSSASFAARMSDAARHVIRTKYGAGLLPCSPTKA